MGNIKETDNGLKGGILKGDKHSDPSGGIDAIVVTDNNRPVKLEDEEAIVTAKTMNSNKKHEFDGKEMTPKEIISDLNQEGDGVAIYKGGGNVMGDGGELTAKSQKPKAKNKEHGGLLVAPIINSGENQSKKDKHFIIRAKYSTITAPLYSSKLFRFEDIQPGGYLLVWCNKKDNYCLIKITKKTYNTIKGIDISDNKKTEINDNILFSLDTIYFGKEQIMAKGGKVLSNRETIYTPITNIFKKVIKKLGWKEGKNVYDLENVNLTKDIIGDYKVDQRRIINEPNYKDRKIVLKKGDREIHLTQNMQPRREWKIWIIVYGEEYKDLSGIERSGFEEDFEFYKDYDPIENFYKKLKELTTGKKNIPEIKKPKGYNDKAWHWAVEESKKDKEWAKNHEHDKEWKKMASIMSLEMLKKRLNKPVDQLAKEKYDYLKMRAHATSEITGEHIAPDSLKKWQEITKNEIVKKKA